MYRVHKRGCRPGGCSAFFAIVALIAGTADYARADQAGDDASPSLPQVSAEQRAKAEAFREDLSKEAKGGNINAMIDMATLVEQGDLITPADRAAALDLFEKVADRHDQVGREKMCVAYLLGEGRPKDIAKAATYCEPLGVHDPVGMFWAGYDYQYGISGPADEASALDIYGQAINLGSGDAADEVGQIAAQKKAPTAARNWYRRGVMLGSADAMDHLAAMTEAGDGGDVDTVEAAWLYGYAAFRGNTHAQAWVKDHPDSGVAGSIVLSADNGKKAEFIHSYTAKGRPATEVFDITRITKLLTDYFPDSSYYMQMEGKATIDCYITTRHQIDTCVVSEFPIAAGFGPTLESFFSGRVSVGDLDAKDQPTAQRRLLFRVNWVLCTSR